MKNVKAGQRRYIQTDSNVRRVMFQSFREGGGDWRLELRPLESFKNGRLVGAATAPAGMDYADQRKGRRLKFSFQTSRTAPSTPTGGSSIGFQEDICGRGK